MRKARPSGEPLRLILEIVMTTRNNWKAFKTTKARLMAFRGARPTRTDDLTHFRRFQTSWIVRTTFRSALGSIVSHVYQMRRNERAIYAQGSIERVRIFRVNEYVRARSERLYKALHPSCSVRANDSFNLAKVAVRWSSINVQDLIPHAGRMPRKAAGGIFLLLINWLDRYRINSQGAER